MSLLFSGGNMVRHATSQAALAGPTSHDMPAARGGLRRVRPPLVIPLLLLLVLTAVFHFTDADLAVSRPFFGGARNAWPVGDAQPWQALYWFGCYPGLLLGIGGLVVATAGVFASRLRTWRRESLFLGLFLLLGPGLMVNLVAKPQWCRPRPHQVTAFGGNWQFRPVGQFNWRCDCRSFPSGHAAMGFFLMAPAFLFYRRRPRLALAFIVLGLLGGGAMGLARIAQGRHFASDVLWSAGIIYFTGLGLWFALRLGEDASAPRRATPFGWTSAGPTHGVQPTVPKMPVGAAINATNEPAKPREHPRAA